MQSRRQTSAPVPPFGELDETRTLSLILAHSIQYAKTRRHPKHGKYIVYCIAVGGKQSYGHRQHLRKIWCNFDELFFRSTSGHTDKQTDTLTAIFRTPKAANK